MMAESINPASGEILATYRDYSANEIGVRASQSSQAYASLRRTDFTARSKWMYEVADLLEKEKEKWAGLMTQEMGKLRTEALAEVEKCAWVCRFYADNAAEFLKDRMITSDAYKSYVSYQPLGSILAIMPWNFPFWQVFRFAAPTLMAGNTAVLKHASNVPQCALAIEEIFHHSGFPTGSFQTLLVPGKAVEKLIAMPEIKAVTLTGSGPAGRSVAAAAGKHLKKSLLELGGSDPYIILEDADVHRAVDIAVKGRLLNCGQSCIGAKRFIVVGDNYESFLHLFTSKMEGYKMGDPSDINTELAPMASQELRDELHLQIEDAVSAGANLVLGGKIPDRAGAYYPPTIMTDVKKGMRAYTEELFGPAAVVYRARDEKEAIKIANDSPFGLGACVISTDVQRAESIAREQLEAGSCFVNAPVASDPRLPFGGIKESGYGRELAEDGIKAFMNIKTVSIV
ncbi:MAG: NAD-dependent succinate-semialdehyde dehydrogenase [Saprospiraceae bacterium]|nr:NAD-dependent succinate-semialdehyde dehydrogenase [Saprospiraceae bacterium]